MRLYKGIMGSFLAVAVSATGCLKGPGGHHSNLPPSEMLMQPGPGVGGPGPGVMTYAGEGYAGPAIGMSSQFAFLGPEGMAVNWDVSGYGTFDSEPLITPGRQNFAQGSIYRLKLTNLPGRPGLELYPTLEVGPATPRTDAYLAHNAIPIKFTEEDLDQVQSGNFVTKVIYLPDPEFQELAIAGAETLVSTRLDPGIDPIVEADRRGSILAIIRVGNKDLQVPGGELGADEIVPAGYHNAGHGHHGHGHHGHGHHGGGYVDGGYGNGGYAEGCYGDGAGYGGPPGNVAGVTTPQYGMPITGTPIGLPGPPHIPLGVPAGLQKHVIRNHTHTHIPEPVKNFKIDVRQKPGYSYPKPVSRVHIKENTRPPATSAYAPEGTFDTPVDNGVQGDCYDVQSE
jgi:hypothetical protein